VITTELAKLELDARHLETAADDPAVLSDFDRLGDGPLDSVSDATAWVSGFRVANEGEFRSEAVFVEMRLREAVNATRTLSAPNLFTTLAATQLFRKLAAQPSHLGSLLRAFGEVFEQAIFLLPSSPAGDKLLQSLPKPYFQIAKELEMVYIRLRNTYEKLLPIISQKFVVNARLRALQKIILQAVFSAWRGHRESLDSRERLTVKILSIWKAGQFSRIFMRWRVAALGGNVGHLKSDAEPGNTSASKPLMSRKQSFGIARRAAATAESLETWNAKLQAEVTALRRELVAAKHAHETLDRETSKRIAELERKVADADSLNNALAARCVNLETRLEMLHEITDALGGDVATAAAATLQEHQQIPCVARLMDEPHTLTCKRRTWVESLKRMDDVREDLTTMPEDTLVVRWANQFLREVAHPKRIVNFGPSLSDGDCLAHVLQQLGPPEDGKADGLKAAKVLRLIDPRERRERIVRAMNAFDLEVAVDPNDLANEIADHNARSLTALMLRRPALRPHPAESAALSASLLGLQAELAVLSCCRPSAMIRDGLGKISSAEEVDDSYRRLCDTVHRIVAQRHALAEANNQGAVRWTQVKTRLRRWTEMLIRARCEGKIVQNVDEASRRQFLEFTIIDQRVIANLSPNDAKDAAFVQAQLAMTLQTHFERLQSVFALYSAGNEKGSSSGTMDLDEFTQLIADCDLLGDPAQGKLSREEVNYLFYVVNRESRENAKHEKQQADQTDEKGAVLMPAGERAVFGGDTELTSKEFVLALLHMAATVYSRQEAAQTLVEKVQKLIVTIDAKAGQSSQQEFRSLCKRSDVRAVLAHYSDALKKLFKYYACIESSSNNGRAERMIKITTKTFLALFKDAVLMDNVLTQKALLTIFANVQHESGEAVNRDEPDDTLEMSFPEFQESVIATALYKFPNPYLSFPDRLEWFVRESIVMPTMHKTRIKLPAKMCDVQKPEGEQKASTQRGARGSIGKQMSTDLGVYRDDASTG
jgi:hypothetical protein